MEEAKLGNSWRNRDSFFIAESEVLWIPMDGDGLDKQMQIPLVFDLDL